jgi:antitoxin (DNA-binding transcriptional repressor) of toxin-antitoxin stability system
VALFESGAKTDHMKKVSVSGLRNKFKEIERLLHRGEEIQITKRGQVIARLVPECGPDSARLPDFLARLRAIYGEKTLRVSGAELVAEERDRH